MKKHTMATDSINSKCKPLIFMEVFREAMNRKAKLVALLSIIIAACAVLQKLCFSSTANPGAQRLRTIVRAAGAKLPAVIGFPLPATEGLRVDAAGKEHPVPRKTGDKKSSLFNMKIVGRTGHDKHRSA